MNIKIFLLILFVKDTLKMFKKDSPMFLQNINMMSRQLFLLFKKSTTFWDNPRIQYMNLAVRKSVLGVSNQVRHKPVCTATEDG